MNILPVPDAQWSALVDFVVQANAQRESHTVYFGATPAEIEHSLETLRENGQTILIAQDADRIIGVLGADQDLDLQRVWWYGPVMKGTPWQPVADQLYANGKAQIAPEINDEEVCFDLENQAGLQFAARQGLPIRGDWDVLFITRAQLESVPTLQPELFRPALAEVLGPLHDQLFPNSHLPSRVMFDKLDDQHRLFVRTDGEQLLGYLYASVEPDTGEAFIDFVGVTEQARGRGVGRSLVQTAVHWLFSFPSVENVCLTVETSNRGAYHLYTSAGFQYERSFRAFRKMA